MARVYHADLWGLRQRKYDWLREHDVASTDWEEITPKSEFYLFVPRDEAALERYEKFVSVTDIFPVHSVGIVTSRDAFVIDFDRDALERRIRQFLDPNMPDELIRRTYKLKDKKNWRLADARATVRKDEAWQDSILPCLYRPFDVRWLFYHPAVIERGREEVMQHMVAGDNLALITARSNKSPCQDQFFCSKCVVETKCGESTTQSYTFPLYLYEELSPQRPLHGETSGREKRPNVAQGVQHALAEAYGETPPPEEVVGYMYAVMYSPSYREKYAEFLRIDFPRIPFTADRELFEAMAELGGRLVDLHLLKSDELDTPAARFEGEGENKVARTKGKGFRYEPDDERVYVNKTQYFAPVPLELWEYQVGGYQVLHKWLKDRKDRPLSMDEIKTYCRIVTALKVMIEIQEEIDALYPKVEERIVEVDL